MKVRMLKDVRAKFGQSLTAGVVYDAQKMPNGRAQVTVSGSNGYIVSIVVDKKSYEVVPEDEFTVQFVLGEHSGNVAEALIDRYGISGGNMNEVQKERDGFMDADCLYVESETFKTKAERDAFIRGLNAASGYLDSLVLDDDEAETLNKILEGTKVKEK